MQQVQQQTQLKLQQLTKSAIQEKFSYSLMYRYDLCYNIHLIWHSPHLSYKTHRYNGFYTHLTHSTGMFLLFTIKMGITLVFNTNAMYTPFPERLSTKIMTCDTRLPNATGITMSITGFFATIVSITAIMI